MRHDFPLRSRENVTIPYKLVLEFVETRRIRNSGHGRGEGEHEFEDRWHEEKSTNRASDVSPEAETPNSRFEVTERPRQRRYEGIGGRRRESAADI